MKSNVNVGEHYRDSATLWSEWRIERIYEDFQGLPHAVMSSIVDPTEVRTLACPILSDRRRYSRVAPGESPGQGYMGHDFSPAAFGEAAA